MAIILSRPSVHTFAKADDEACAREEFERLGLHIQYSRGERYLGGFVGNSTEEDKWIKEKVENWVQDVLVMSDIAPSTHRLCTTLAL